MCVTFIERDLRCIDISKLFKTRPIVHLCKSQTRRPFKLNSTFLEPSVIYSAAGYEVTVKYHLSIKNYCHSGMFKRKLFKYTKTMKYTVKPVLSGHSKKDKTNILMSNGSLMKVESIAECSPWSILQYF